MTRFRNIFRLNYEYSDPFDQLRGRGINAISWTVIVVIAVYYVSSLFIRFSATNRGLGIPLALAFGLVIMLINRGQLNAASVSLCVLLFVIALLAYLTSPIPTNFIIFSVPIVAAGSILNRRGMLVMILLTLTALVLAWLFLSTNDITPISNITSDAQVNIPAREFLLSIASLILSGFILVFFAGGQRAIQRRNIALTNELRNSTTVAQLLTSAATLDALLDQAVLLIRDQIGYYHVRIFMIEQTANLLVSDASTTNESRRLRLDESPLLSEVINTVKPIVITRHDAANRQQEMVAGMRTQVLTPIKRGDLSVLGILDVQNPQEDSVTKTDIEVLETVAAQLSIAIQNVQMAGTLQSVTKEREQLANDLRVNTAQLESLSQEGEGRAWSSYLEGRGEEVIGLDWRSGTLMSNVYISPAMERAFANTTPELIKDGTEQILTVPIISRGQRLGAMEFRASADKEWSNRSIELAQVIAQRLALALDNIRLFEQAQIIAHREQVASQVAATLQAKTDLDALVTSAAEAFQQALGATRTSIRLGLPAEKLPTEKTSQNGSHLS